MLIAPRNQTLASLQPGRIGCIETCQASPQTEQRLYALGCLPGTTVEFLGVAPLGDPIRVRVGDTILALRRTEASCVILADPEALGARE